MNRRRLYSERLLVCALAAGLAVGCASTQPEPARHAQPALQIQEADLAVAGWRIPFECLELSERIEASQARLYDATSGSLSTRSTDARRLRSLESRADELGCLLPGSPFAY
jgi:hypothetical protein